MQCKIFHFAVLIYFEKRFHFTITQHKAKGENNNNNNNNNNTLLISMNDGQSELQLMIETTVWNHLKTSANSDWMKGGNKQGNRLNWSIVQ